MEKKYRDDEEEGEGEEKDEGREQLTLEQNKYYPRRPLSNCTTDDYQVSFVIYSIFFYLNIFFKHRSIKILDVEQQTIMNVVIHRLFFHLNVFLYT
jgi:hypothetical protein